MITEGNRLKKDLQHKIEFILTTYWIDKYLQKGMKILVIGTDTKTYSLNLSKKGYEVEALELVKHNLEILKSKITTKNNIKLVQGKALDLSIYENNYFDMVLCLGPLYYLDNPEKNNV